MSTKTPPAPTTPVDSPTAAEVPCQAERPAAARKGHVLVYFWCINELQARSRKLPSGVDPMQFALGRLIAGPTREERALELGGGAPDPAMRGEVRQDAGVVTVDLDGSTFALERFLASLNFSAKAMRATMSQFVGVQDVVITVDGESLCSLDPECQE